MRKLLRIGAKRLIRQAIEAALAELLARYEGQVDERGEKRFLAIEDGVRESTQNRREVLPGLKKRGLTIPPWPATGDGTLGFWAAPEEVYRKTRHQRCWVHRRRTC